MVITALRAGKLILMMHMEGEDGFGVCLDLLAMACMKVKTRLDLRTLIKLGRSIETQP